MEETLTMQPAAPRAIASPKTWMGSSVPTRLRSKTSPKASRDRSKIVASPLRVALGTFPPAALTKISTLPQRPNTVSRASRSCPSSKALAGRATASPPTPEISRATSLALSSRRPSTPTPGACAGKPRCHLAAEDSGRAGHDGDASLEGEEIFQCAVHDPTSPSRSLDRIPLEPVGFPGETVGELARHVVGVFLVHHTGDDRACEPVAGDPAPYVVARRDGGEGPRIVVEARGVVQTRRLHHRVQVAPHAKGTVEEPPRCSEEQGRVVSCHGRELPGVGALVKGEGDKAEARVVAKLVQEGTQPTRPVGGYWYVRARVQAETSVHRFVVVAQAASVQLHDQPVLGAHASHLHEHVGSEPRGVLPVRPSAERPVEDFLRLSLWQALRVRSSGAVVGCDRPHLLEEGAPHLYGVHERAVINDVYPGCLRELLHVLQPGGG